MEQAYLTLQDEPPDANLAYFLSQLARWLFFAGRYELCDERNERAREIAEALRLQEVLSHSLNTKGLLELERGHLETSLALQRHALAIAIENDLPDATMRGYINLSVTESRIGNYAEADDSDHSVHRDRTPDRRPRGGMVHHRQPRRVVLSRRKVG